jgi:hypothetical protein
VRTICWLSLDRPIVSHVSNPVEQDFNVANVSPSGELLVDQDGGSQSSVESSS